MCVPGTAVPETTDPPCRGTGRPGLGAGDSAAVVRHDGLKGGDFGNLVGLKTIRLEQVYGRHKQRRVVVVRKEGQLEIKEELVKYMKVSTNCR